MPGAMIMQGLLRRTFPLLLSPVGDAGARAGGADKFDRPHLRPCCPRSLSFGIPFALIRWCADRRPVGHGRRR